MTENTHTRPHFDSIAALRRAVTDTGSHFFSRDTMKFFGSKVERAIYGGNVFVTSEQDMMGGYVWDGERRWTVRVVHPERDGFLSVDTVGEMGEYETVADARAAAREYVKNRTDQDY